MIKVHLEEDSLPYRIGFVSVCSAALIILNLLAFRTAASLRYNGTLNKLEITKIGLLGIRQTLRLTPKLGTVTFVENESKLVINHPDTRFNHYLNLKYGEVHNENVYERLFAVINER
ncbi:uncharacterized protein LOC134820083 [Bolinopsis microptera]|uniref:uncharacterized protein LOC134820083 n=1 Tax=Bolinopsis microptera TaxID=2820187 RepID=UPI0030795452